MRGKRWLKMENSICVVDVNRTRQVVQLCCCCHEVYPSAAVLCPIQSNQSNPIQDRTQYTQRLWQKQLQ